LNALLLAGPLFFARVLARDAKRATLFALPVTLSALLVLYEKSALFRRTKHVPLQLGDGR
jgi:hypothetical protein